MLVERKDRSYEAGLRDTPERRIAKVVDEARRARIPPEPGALRVLVVGFQHLVRRSEMENVVEYLGLEPRTRGEKSNFFSPQALSWEPRLMKRVGPLLKKAIGA